MPNHLILFDILTVRSSVMGIEEKIVGKHVNHTFDSLFVLCSNVSSVQVQPVHIANW